MSAEMITLYAACFSLLLAVVGYFLKRTMNKVDDHDTKINHIEKTYVEEPALEKVRQELRDEVAGLEQNLKQETGKLASDIAEIKENCLRKDDFIRTMASMDRKIDKLTDYIVGTKGDKNNGQ